MSSNVNRELKQQDGWNTQDGRMTKRCRVRLGTHSLAPHFLVILLPGVFQPSCCVSSLIALMIPPYPLKEYQSVQKLLSVNLSTDIAPKRYQHCQIISRRRAPLKWIFRIMEQQFLMVDFRREITKEMELGWALKYLWGEVEKEKGEVTSSRRIP